MVADIRRGEGGAVVAGGEEGAQGAGGARGTGGAGGKGDAVKTAMLKFSLLYPLYSCGAAADGYKYNTDIVQILEPNHPPFGKAGHFQVNFGGKGLLEQ